MKFSRRVTIFAGVALFLWLGVRPCFSQSQTLTITAPATGASFAPGATVNVTVTTSDPAITQIILTTDPAIAFVGSVNAPGPYTFSVPLPTAMSPGTYHMMAIGSTGAGQGVQSISPPVYIAVERTDTATASLVRPTSLTLPYVGAQKSLAVSAAFLSGTSTVTGSNQTQYASSDTTVATVAAGVVTAVKAGSATITVQYASLTAIKVPVTVVAGTPPVVCTIAASSNPTSFTGSGGSGTVTVTASDPSCQWSALGSPEIAFTGTAYGIGSGSVAFTEGANPSQSGRTSAIYLGGQTINLSQAGTPCSYTVGFPITGTIPAVTGSGSATVTAVSGCAWTASSDSAWFQITSGASGSGNGSVGFTVAANTATTSRNATITIAGQTFPVTQAGVPPCTYTAAFPPGTVVVQGETGTATVTTQSGCAWTASSGVSWLTITSGASGTGNGSAGFTVSANTSGFQRSGTVTIAGQAITVTQAGLGCSFLLGSAGVSAPSTGGVGSVGLSASATDCPWTATSNASWLVVTSGASGTGAGTVGFSVAANPNVATRNGTITIGGLPFNVSDAGLTGSVSLNPAAVSPPKAGGTGTITVTANAPDFAWTVVSDSTTWLTVTAGASGTGNGSVSWSATGNNGASTRVGHLAIGGQTFTVTQPTTSAGPLLFATNAGNNYDQVAILDTNANTVLGYAPSPGGFTHGVTMKPDGTQAWVADNYGNEVVVIDSATRAVVANIPVPGYPRYVFLLPDGSRAYAVTQAATVAIIDTATYTVLQTLDVTKYNSLYQQYPPYYMCAAIMPAGDFAFLLDVGGTITVLDTIANQVTARLTPGTPGYDSFQWIALSPDATKMYFTDSGLQKMFVMDTRTLAPLGSVSVPGYPRGITISPDGTKAYVANESVDVQVIDLATLTLTKTIPTADNGSRGIAVSADGSKVYTTEASHIAVIDTATNTVTTSIPVPGSMVQLTLQLPQPPLRLSASLTTVGGNAGSSAFNVTTVAPGTAWTAVSNTSWITITAGSGTGNGTVTFSVAPNTTGVQQIGTISVGGAVYSVIQKAAAYTVTLLGGADLPLAASTLPLSPFPTALATDGAGNLFVGMIPRGIYKIALDGSATRVAGNGMNWYGGDGVAATSTGFAQASGVAVDASGNLYFSDQWDNRVRKVTAATGIVSTIAGTGTYGYSGDGGQAISAMIAQPAGIVVDSAGNVFFYDTGNNRIRRIDGSSHAITTYAGNGQHGYSGEGLGATSNKLGTISGMAIDSQKNLYISEIDNNRIRKIAAGTTIITTIAGTGVQGYSGDNIPATTAGIVANAVAVDAAGNVYIGDGSRIREVNPTTGLLTTVAGNGNYGYSGDGVEATATSLGWPQSLAIDPSGNIYTGEQNINRVRKITRSTGMIGTLIGGTLGDGGPATSASFTEPVRSAVDSGGNVYIADSLGMRVRKINSATGTITTFAGNGTAGFSGDGGAATSASLSFPSSVAVDGADNVYIGDSGNNRVRRVDASTGFISTVAGAGPGYGGDGAPATSALFGYTLAVAVDGNANLYISDSDNNRIRKVDSLTGNVQTVAGNGARGYSGDNGPATNASFGYLQGLAVDPQGNLYLPDGDNYRIRKVDAVTHVISTQAGNGVWNYTGDTGPATSAQLGYVIGIGVAAGGDIFFADFSMNGIRRISNGTMFLVGGGNGAGNAGDGGPAPSAQFVDPEGIAVGRDGTLYVADSNGNRARKLTPPLPACLFTLDRAQQPATAAGGGFTSTVSVSGTGCNWTAVSNSPWLAVTAGATGIGGGTVGYTASGNSTGKSRIGEITIAGQALSVIQSGVSAGLTITVTYSAMFLQGENDAKYTVTVSNGAGASATSGTVTVTDTLPVGLTLVSMEGSGWNCPTPGNSCNRSDVLSGGSSYPPIIVTVKISSTAPAQVTNQAGVSGGGSAGSSANAITPISSLACDVNSDGAMDIVDVQLLINETLGKAAASHDLNHDGSVNVVDMQKLVNGVMGLGCTTP